jgi:enediyne biosynthesis protein E4
LLFVALAAVLTVASALLCAPNAGPIFDEWLPAKTGIVWRHDNAKSPRRYQPESIGPGIAVLDYNNDGRMDLYFPNSGPSDFFHPANPPRPALYRNNGDGSFTDVTEAAGVLDAGQFGIGAAAADYNGDGFVDLLVTNYGHNILYRNLGNGKFEDVTHKAGLDAPGIYTSAVWFDYNNDGKPDLFAGHFVHYSKDLEKDCSTNGVYHYCYPISYDPWPSKLYRNNGNGTFTDVSASSGIARHPGKTFGAVAVDLDGDGYMDLFVSNDSVPDFLFHNKGDGTFDEIGLEAGVAYSDDGMARSGMGVDAADYDGDGRPDLFVANLNRERFSLYRNLGGLSFKDMAGPSRIGFETYLYSGWGVRFFDFDNNGSLDLILANGHPDDLIETSHTGLTWKEPILLLENRNGVFINRGASAGAPFSQTYAARGLAVADLDNDGFPDVVITTNGGPPLILHNRGGSSHWIGLRNVKPGSIVRWPGGSRFITAGGGYLSSSDPRVLIGLGQRTELPWIEVDHPGNSAKSQRIDRPAIDRYLDMR